MPTLYEVLGLEPNATTADIRLAYRRASSANHPDKFATESPEEQAAAKARMQAINQANDVLSDPERRAKYDATGSAEEVKPLEAKAEAMAREYLDLALEGAPIGDVLKHARGLIDKSEALCMSTRIGAFAQRDKLTQRRAKFLTQPGGRNLLHEIIDHKLAGLDNVIRVAEETIEVAKLARELLKPYSTTEGEPTIVVDVGPVTSKGGILGMLGLGQV